MKLLMRCAAALLLAGALAGASLAQDQAPPQGTPGQDQGPPDQGGHGGHHGGAVRAACQADIAKLCSADDTGGGGGHGDFCCLRDHQDAVSDSCKSAMATARAERQAHGGGWSHGPSGPSGGGGANGGN